VRRRVGRGRAFVEFHVGAETTDALVVTEDGARLVDLGATAAFAALCRSVRAGDAAADSVAAARTAIVDALKLPSDVRTLLVVPDGPLVTVPFALLDPGRDVATIPSALVWTLLDAARGERGVGVLAVGDPDYAGTRLAALPATRAEVSAVGTRVLVGREATEDAVRRVLVESPRWRAVHFACHGVVDPRHASLCGLALTRALGDDGILTAREVLGLPVPADVVVLSACEAGRPGAESASAATGLPPAFLAAGCARVVASLWRVDDEAGRVFSVAFHRAWATDGVTVAQALREARDAVRADPRFAAPRHWAGWVLWGLPD
jgi:CHAT domain-containing protein